jgi:hypothetical protein
MGILGIENNCALVRYISDKAKANETKNCSNENTQTEAAKSQCEVSKQMRSEAEERVGSFCKEAKPGEPTPDKSVYGNKCFLAISSLNEAKIKSLNVCPEEDTAILSKECQSALQGQLNAGNHVDAYCPLPTYEPPFETLRGCSRIIRELREPAFVRKSCSDENTGTNEGLKKCVTAFRTRLEYQQLVAGSCGVRVKEDK